MDLGLIKHKIRKHRIVFLIVFFLIYMFEYMVTLTFIDYRNTGVSDPYWQLAQHYVDCIFCAAA